MFSFYHFTFLFFFFFFFFNDTATTEIYTLSLHDALPILPLFLGFEPIAFTPTSVCPSTTASDRKSTRLNSSHMSISYAVFCLKKKQKPEAKPAHTAIKEEQSLKQRRSGLF